MSLLLAANVFGLLLRVIIRKRNDFTSQKRTWAIIVLCSPASQVYSGLVGLPSAWKLDNFMIILMSSFRLSDTSVCHAEFLCTSVGPERLFLWRQVFILDIFAVLLRNQERITLEFPSATYKCDTGSGLLLVDFLTFLFPGEKPCERGCLLLGSVFIFRSQKFASSTDVRIIIYGGWSSRQRLFGRHCQGSSGRSTLAVSRGQVWRAEIGVGEF